MGLQEIHNTIRSHDEEKHIVRIQVYADHRAMDFTVAYLQDLIDKGKVPFKNFKLTNCFIEREIPKRNEWIFEVYYQPLMDDNIA